MASNGSQTGGSAATQAPAETPAAAPVAAPNQYHLSGDGITVSYFPQGRGPIGPAGAIHFVYQDAIRTLTFTADEVRIVDVPDLGTVVSVSIQTTVDIGYTSFSVLVPYIRLADTLGASAPVQTEGITTLHRSPLFPIGQAQTETYTVCPLTGTATLGILEL